MGEKEKGRKNDKSTQKGRLKRLPHEQESWTKKMEWMV